MKQFLQFVDKYHSQFLWMRVFMVCGVIFGLSSMPNYKEHVVDFQSFQGILDYCLPKMGHLMEYGLLFVVTYPAIDKILSTIGSKTFLVTFLFTLLFAISDEWHQTFVFGRDGTVVDVLIDCLGSLAGAGYRKMQLNIFNFR